ncbi:hypothetical protein GCWU000282_02721 [Catonella morbi ATCC 51271]|uniref:Uncharacterized protein n=1 Tax=Catonella morbi ATCC 51271 TaxID=592026 RepID=V2XYT6_9FIRM|nr:hypothetical protein GCWU000282_02721 [Catonella morbi ATCC 51271]
MVNKNLSEGCASYGREVCLTAPLEHEVCANSHFIVNKRFGGKRFVKSS